MKDERFDPEDLERAKVAATRYGKDEAEEQRLMALGRRADQLLRSVPPDVHAPLHLIRSMHDNHAEMGYPGAAWSWFISALREDPHG